MITKRITSREKSTEKCREKSLYFGRQGVLLGAVLELVRRGLREGKAKPLDTQA